MVTITSGDVIIRPDLVMLFSDQAQAGNLVHQIIDRAEPEIDLRPASLATGTLKLFFLDAASCAAARNAHMQAATFTVDAPDQPWLPAAYVPNGTIRREQQENRKRWMLEVDYQELAS